MVPVEVKFRIPVKSLLASTTSTLLADTVPGVTDEVESFAAINVIISDPLTVRLPVLI